ncbi:MAG: efflux RND transporter periplasmic adaptor subunit [Acidobacteriota bacterium]
MTMCCKNCRNALFLACIVTAGCTSSEQTDRAGSEVQGLDPTPDPFSSTIETQTVTSSVLSPLIAATGSIRIPEDRVAVIGPVHEGRLVKFYVGQGSRVKRGQRLADLESADIDEAKADYLRALADRENARRVSESEVKLAQSTYDRTQLLYKKTITARKNLLAAERDLEVAKSNAENSLASAGAALEAARRRLLILGLSPALIEAFHDSPNLEATFSLLSPIAGVVVERNATIGATVGADANVFKIVNPSRVWIDADVFEKDVARVSLGQSVKVSVSAYPGQSFSGRVIFISPLVDAETRTVKVRTEVPNPVGKLKLGMFADIQIETRLKRATLAVPRGAVLNDGAASVVFVWSDGGYQKRAVLTGIQEGDKVEIRKGLREGDKVVIKGNYLLLEQSRRQGPASGNEF